MKQLIIEALLPAAVTLATALIPIMIGFALDRFHKWTGIEIEARHREALQSALANAARLILAGATRSEGVSYVMSSVPDALKALKVDGAGKIEGLLEPHLAKRIADRKFDDLRRKFLGVADAAAGRDAVPAGDKP